MTFPRNGDVQPFDETIQRIWILLRVQWYSVEYHAKQGLYAGSRWRFTNVLNRLDSPWPATQIPKGPNPVGGYEHGTTAILPPSSKFTQKEWPVHSRWNIFWWTSMLWLWALHKKKRIWRITDSFFFRICRKQRQRVCKRCATVKYITVLHIFRTTVVHIPPET